MTEKEETKTNDTVRTKHTFYDYHDYLFLISEVVVVVVVVVVIHLPLPSAWASNNYWRIGWWWQWRWRWLWQWRWWWWLKYNYPTIFHIDEVSFLTARGNHMTMQQHLSVTRPYTSRRVITTWDRRRRSSMHDRRRGTTHHKRATLFVRWVQNWVPSTCCRCLRLLLHKDHVCRRRQRQWWEGREWWKQEGIEAGRKRTHISVIVISVRDEIQQMHPYLQWS